jgi:anti-anti-sigma factor
MEVEVRRLSVGRVEVRIEGRLVEESLEHLRPDLLDRPRGPAAVLLNLSQLSEIDSAGMALLLLARVEREAMGGRFVVESSNPQITKALRAAGMNDFVRIEERRTDAMRALGADKAPEPVHDRLPEITRRRWAERPRRAPAARGGGVAAVYAR